jgi:hypothetical protein
MFPMVVFFLFMAAGIAAFKAKQAVEAGDRRAFLRRLAMGVPLLALACSATWLLLQNPSVAYHLPPSGLGSDWDCAHYGKGTEVCFKHNQSGATDPPK